MVKRRKTSLVALAIFGVVAYAASGQLSTYLGYIEEHEYFVSHGVRIHFADLGAGDPVVLLHGYGMNSDISWHNPGVSGRLVDEGFRVIAMDFRGHGLSDKPLDPADYGIEMAEDVGRLLDHLGIERAHIVGNSMGAMVGLKFSTLHPERVQSVVSCGMGLAQRDTRRLETVDALVEALETRGSFEPLVNVLLPEELRPPSIVMSAVNTYIGSIINDREPLIAMTKGLPELTCTPKDFMFSDTPVLNIMGSYDPLLEDAADLEAVVEDYELVVVEGVSHFNLMSQTETQDAMSAFLAAHRMGDAPGIGS